MGCGRHGAIVAVVAASCGGAQVAPVSAPPQLELIVSGEEPRAPLRYVLAPNGTERSEMTMQMRVAISLAGQRGAIAAKDLPPKSAVAQLAVVSVAPDGDAEVSIEAAEPALHGTYHLSPTGEVSQLAFQLPPATTTVGDRTMSPSELAADSVRFPDAPVGIGATWRVTSTTARFGIVWQRRVLYRIVARTDSSVTLDVAASSTAGSQTISVEPRRTVELTSASFGVSSQLVVPLHGLAVTSDATGRGELNFAVSGIHADEVATFHFELHSKMQPLPP